MTISEAGTAYDIVGPETAPVITLVHGIGVKRQLWEEFVLRFSRHYRVLTYDLLGHGESARPNSKLSLSSFADQLNELLDELEIERSVIVGFSLGGMINRRFAMDYPEKSSALVIMNSPHRRSEAEQLKVENRARHTELGGPAANIDESMVRWFTPDFLRRSHSWTDKVRQWILANDPVTYAESRQVLAEGILELIEPGPGLDLPVLVITCEHDSGSNPQMAAGIAADIPGAQCLVIPGLRHLGMLEDAGSFLDPIETFVVELRRQ